MKNLKHPNQPDYKTFFILILMALAVILIWMIKPLFGFMSLFGVRIVIEKVIFF